MTAPAVVPPILTGLAALADHYDAIICDVWGVIHNGVAADTAAVHALMQFRTSGKRVVLVTNSPRREASVIAQLSNLGIGPTAFDAVVTSGELTFARLRTLGVHLVYQIGPPRDLVFYEGTDIALVGADNAEIVVCSGLEDEENGQPEDYRDVFRRMVARGLSMLCANPDIVVERGPRRIWCAGALARIYSDIGGRVEQFGKPHPTIYEAAVQRIANYQSKTRVLAIGDGIDTDIRGAVAQQFDALFVAGGIHQSEFGDIARPNARLIASRLASEGLRAIGIVPTLRWA